MLTRLGGQPMAVNPDLIEKAEATPDTVITLVDGHKFVVAESVQGVVDRVREWRASVAAEAFALSEPGPARTTTDRADASHPSSGRTPAVREEGGLAADGSGRAPLARVLRMPAREE
ncbi:MAG TPA: flagellar FlbD family protein [Kineosporiaceae bacterium]